ncbi:MAG: LytTR family DNA-binding domain-containing protein [Acidobacteriota bacterium]|nr:LytTR family DNA-binding domain-containing protein [Acidobacteriota bacterium]
MKKIRAAIVDDEPFARERVRRLLAEDVEIEIVGEAGDGAEAVALIRAKAPDLIFLDVQMPGAGGFDALAELAPGETPVVIFLTAFDQYAVRAFESSALDYLLKPFDEERFRKAVNRAKTQIERVTTASIQKNQAESETATGEVFGLADGFLERVLVKKGGRVFFFKTDEIEWIEAYGNYVRLHFETATYLLRETITSLEVRLDPQKFTRIHRSGLVNLEHIREMQPIFGGRAKIVLASGAELTASRRYNRKLSKLFGK